METSLEKKIVELKVIATDTIATCCAWLINQGHEDLALKMRDDFVEAGDEIVQLTKDEWNSIVSHNMSRDPDDSWAKLLY